METCFMVVSVLPLTGLNWEGLTHMAHFSIIYPWPNAFTLYLQSYMLTNVDQECIITRSRRLLSDSFLHCHSAGR